MIEAIKTAISFIVDSITSIWEFIITIVEDIVYVIETLGNFVTRIFRYLAFIPGPILAIFTIGITGAVVFKIVGRDG